MDSNQDVTSQPAVGGRPPPPEAETRMVLSPTGALPHGHPQEPAPPPFFLNGNAAVQQQPPALPSLLRT